MAAASPNRKRVAKASEAVMLPEQEDQECGQLADELLVWAESSSADEGKGEVSAAAAVPQQTSDEGKQSAAAVSMYPSAIKAVGGSSVELSFEPQVVHQLTSAAPPSSARSLPLPQPTPSARPKAAEVTDRLLDETSTSPRSPSRIPQEKPQHKFLPPETLDEILAQEQREKEAREKFPHEFDNEGRRYDMSRIVVNFNNVGTFFGKDVQKIGPTFHWEGVRRCVASLKDDLKVGVIGVLYQNWKAPDTDKKLVHGVPSDIAEMIDLMVETPRLVGEHHKSADDEMTIKCAYRRNCRFLDNDNYRDWGKRMKNQKCRAWLEHSQERLHMKYYFDPELGCFELLEGNAQLPPTEQPERMPNQRHVVSNAATKRSKQMPKERKPPNDSAQSPPVGTVVPKSPPPEQLPYSSNEVFPAHALRELQGRPSKRMAPMGLHPDPVRGSSSLMPRRSSGSEMALLPTQAGFRVPVGPSIELMPELMETVRPSARSFRDQLALAPFATAQGAVSKPGSQKRQRSLSSSVANVVSVPSAAEVMLIDSDSRGSRAALPSNMLPLAHPKERESPQVVKRRMQELSSRLEPKSRGLAASPVAVDPYGGLDGIRGSSNGISVDDANMFSRRKRKTATMANAVARLAGSGEIDLTDDLERSASISTGSVGMTSAMKAAAALFTQIPQPGVDDVLSNAPPALAAAVESAAHAVATVDPYL